MELYAAIREMRQLTKIGKPFSFSFMSYDRTRQRTDGIVTVNSARLRARGHDQYNQHAQLQEEYLDLNTNEPRRFWHCCLMTFNGQRVHIP
ncbi:MAG TPA: hypothetical protein VNQ80_12255 [Parapedobacter sp.]|uniref:hypothetical protein n=1 Tax=Parapedobacter sp. TaxID=1958893 RepID=UPI002CC5692F|nr:hypothetical protein [Parapedobacter sp.]HWK58109.1 hypothetical protein [Parapedobacter sp.]